jgi:hypothetical protein
VRRGVEIRPEVVDEGGAVAIGREIFPFQELPRRQQKVQGSVGPPFERFGPRRRRKVDCSWRLFEMR